MAAAIAVLIFAVIFWFLSVALLRSILRLNHICKRLDRLAAAAGYADAQKALDPNATERKPSALERWLEAGGTRYRTER